MGIKGRGFTLLELLIALAILGITMAFAMPSFITVISNNRISSGASDFISALQLAKAESAARITPVTLCKKNTAGSGCVAAGDWQQGWIVFSDINGDGTVNGADTIVLNHEALNPNISFGGTGGLANAITYRPSGRTSITATQVLIVCDVDRGFADGGKGILVTITGRGNVMKAADTGQTTCI